MVRGKNRNQVDRILGPLPVVKINRALKLELEAGYLVLRGPAQAHAEKRHPEEYHALLPKLPEVLSTALYAGDDFKNEGKIELIGRAVELGQFVLIAVVIELGKDGKYSVASFYPVSRTKVQKRKEKGFLSILA